MFSRYTNFKRVWKDYYGLRRTTGYKLEYIVSIRRRRRFQDFLDKMFGWYNEPKKRQKKLKIFTFNDLLHLNNTMKRTKKHTNYNVIDRIRYLKIVNFFTDDENLKKFKFSELEDFQSLTELTNNTDLNNTDLNNTDLNNTDLNNTDLNNTDLNNTDLNNINVNNTDYLN